MADKCVGCTNKYGFFERPSICPECHKSFCQTCLPYQGKKVKKSQPQISLEPCVYCKRQKPINKTEEAEILSNFKERFYDRAHREAPIQSTLRLDLVMRQNSAPVSTATRKEQEGVQLSEEYRALEERLKRLKESHKATAPSYSEEELHKKLECLRDEESEKDGEERDSGKTGSNCETQTEQADKLLEQATDEVRLDNRLRQEGDEELLRRFQELKGNSGGIKSTKGTTRPAPKIDFDIHQLLDKMEEPALGEQDPEQLLKDLQAFQAKEETAALQELKSEEVQGLVQEAHRLANQKEGEEPAEVTGDALTETISPRLSEEECSGPNLPVAAPTGGEASDKAEVAKLLEEGEKELKQEEEQHKDSLKFIEQTSERLDQLRGKDHMTSHDLPDDELVKSKPKASSRGLDFTWSHFGPHTTARPPSSVASAANQLGVIDCGAGGGGFPSEFDEEFDEEVKGLIARTLEESELDSRLEASDLNYHTESHHPEPHKQSDESAKSSNTPSVGATALPPRGSVKGGGGACGLDVDELPWCCICNSDASICCYDCDSDLYCKRCFNEGHKQFGLYDHHYVPYEPQK